MGKKIAIVLNNSMKEFKDWISLIDKRTPAENIEWLRLYHPEYYKFYKDTLKKKGAWTDEVWIRTDDTKIKVEDMSLSQLLAAKITMIEVSKIVGIDTDTDFESNLPPIWWAISTALTVKGEKG